MLHRIFSSGTRDLCFSSPASGAMFDCRGGHGAYCPWVLFSSLKCPNSVFRGPKLTFCMHSFNSTLGCGLRLAVSRCSLNSRGQGGWEGKKQHTNLAFSCLKSIILTPTSWQSPAHVAGDQAAESSKIILLAKTKQKHPSQDALLRAHQLQHGLWQLCFYKNDTGRQDAQGRAGESQCL